MVVSGQRCLYLCVPTNLVYYGQQIIEYFPKTSKLKLIGSQLHVYFWVSPKQKYDVPAGYMGQVISFFLKSFRQK